MFVVYMLELADGSIYTGYSRDLERRLDMHRTGKGSKYVRSRLPLILRYTREFESRSQAMQYEYKLKQLNHKKKLAFIEGNVVC
ncbi:MAG: GIY-YIG nuclease family protein [Candidatus Heimdallarchaeota archaeon]|nr:GIY-YIG nuclease family protein [Candidatus Heimdallarchaeota archaeon]